MATPTPDGAPEPDELFSVEAVDANLPAPTKGKAVAKKKTKPKQTPAPVTQDGDNASDIIGAWIDWYTKSNNGVPIPNTIIARIGKQVKGLIMSGYTTADIKFGLAYWTLKHVETRIPPTQLDSLVWEWASKTRGNHNAWRQAAIRAINDFSGGSVNANSAPHNQTREERQQANRDAIAQWVNK